MTLKVKVQKTEETEGYDVLIGKGLLGRVGDIIKDTIPERCQDKDFLILIGENCARHYLDTVKRSLLQAGYSNIRSVVIGTEKVKHIQNIIPIIIGGNKFHHLLHTIEDYIYIPTTFLGMANNAVMGHPMVTITDVNLLNTLDYKYFMSGYSEIAKHAIMKDMEFFEWLEAHGRSIFDGDENARVYAIKKSCQLKAKFMVDPQEKELLGFGHLYGDAIRKIAKTDLLHGEMISVGMVAAFKLGAYINSCDIEDYKRVRRHLKSMSLPVELYADYWDAEELVEAINFENPIILPKKIGLVENCKKELFHKTLMRVANEIISK